jgi:hypothetical protein
MLSSNNALNSNIPLGLLDKETLPFDLLLYIHIFSLNNTNL